MDPRYDIWDEASDITSDELKAMSERYPKKPRRDEYENEGTRSIFNLDFNDSYKFVNMGHSQLESCFVATEKTGLISKLTSSFNSGSKIDPPVIIRFVSLHVKVYILYDLLIYRCVS